MTKKRRDKNKGEKGNRGHWPAGKRRHDAGPRREAVIARLRKLLDPGERGVLSLVSIAEDLGVSDRTVGRWVSGEDWPDAETVDRLDAWCDDPLARLRERVRDLGRPGVSAAAEALDISVIAARELLAGGELTARQVRSLRRWLRER